MYIWLRLIISKVFSDDLFFQVVDQIGVNIFVQYIQFQLSSDWKSIRDFQQIW